jgi:type VI secretion system protein ImpI
MSREPSPWDLPAAAAEDMGWAQGTPKPPPPQPEPVAVPSPRRPVWVAGEPNGPWAGAAQQPAALAAAQAPAQPVPQPVAQPSPQPAAPWPPAPAAANVLAAAQALAATAAEAGGAAGAGWPPGAARTGGAPGAGTPFPIGGADAAVAADFVRLVARGAGLPDDALAGRNPAELAGELGQLMRLVAENTKQLLEARQQAKRVARSSHHTVVQATNNNPLKFAPTVEDALRIMFGPPTRSYLDARRAFAQSFDDLKAHQVKTFSAMQHALKLLLAEFDPDEIENVSTGDRGLVAVVGSRKARLWDIYVTRWQALTKSHEDGIVNAFMDYFAQCYDRD